MPERETTGFELVPGSGGVLDADAQLDAALGNIPEPDATVPARPLGRSWAFDVNTGQFAMQGGTPRETRGVESLRQWIARSLRVARFAHPYHSADFGIEALDLIGKPPTPDVIGQYANAVRDALLVHDRITEVRDIRFTRSVTDDALLVSFTVEVAGYGFVPIDPVGIGGSEVVGFNDPGTEQRRITDAL